MGIENITTHLLADAEARARRLGRPVVTLSYAQSFDGCLTSRRGEGLALSGAESKLMTHQLRAAHAGILVGIGTVLADDPRLTARLAREADPSRDWLDPRPVILDTTLRFPINSRLLGRELHPWIFCAPHAPAERRRALQERGARLIDVEVDDRGELSLPAVLANLGSAGLSSLMVEGGSRILGSFLLSRLADQAVVTVAPVWVGGLPVVSSSLGAAEVYPAWIDPVLEPFGRDWVVWGRLGVERYETAVPVFPGARAG